MKSLIKSITFVKSSADLKTCPAADKHEYAFAGRSNVGKSSLINLLANNRNLAKISGVPGKTQLINHFLVDEKWYLVDLPGYGYAKTSKKNREIFADMVNGYILNRSNLVTVFVLIDCRIPPQQNDTDFMNFMVENGIPFSIVFTKTDKLGANVVHQKTEEYKKTLLDRWESIPPVFYSSAEKKTGAEEIIGYIEKLNQEIVL